MPKRRIVNYKDLVKMIENGSLQPEILEKFGFKNSTQLKVAYANALMNTGGAPKIKGKGKTKKAKPVNTKVTVNGRGSLIIPKALVDSMKIKADQVFNVKKVASGIQLKKVAKEG